jgi:cytoskeletal protein CcmA (bactofilin family)
MFGKSKDNNQGAPPPTVVKPAAPQLQPQPQPQVQAQSQAHVQPPAAVAAKPMVAPEQPDKALSSISAGMTVVGKIVGDGALKIFGRVDGEIQAGLVLISDGAQVEGNIVAQDLTIGGRVKGTVHAVRVKLLGSALVEGEIYHRSLTIEANARFEGASRRADNIPERPQAAVQPAANPQPAPVAQPSTPVAPPSGSVAPPSAPVMPQAAPVGLEPGVASPAPAPASIQPAASPQPAAASPQPTAASAPIDVNGRFKGRPDTA